MDIGGGNTENRKYNVPLVLTQDAKTLCRCILEFIDVSAVQRLSLTTGPLHFTFFRQCLTGTMRDSMDIVAAAPPQTVNGHQAALMAFIAEVIRATDLADQSHYLETSKKPYKMNCATLAARLSMINKMMSLFPGSNGQMPLQAVDVKKLYYQMMPVHWQRAFLNTGQVITNPNYTLLDLQWFMTLQEDQTAIDVARRWNRLHCNRDPP